MREDKRGRTENPEEIRKVDVRAIQFTWEEVDSLRLHVIRVTKVEKRELSDIITRVAKVGQYGAEYLENDPVRRSQMMDDHAGFIRQYDTILQDRDFKQFWGQWSRIVTRLIDQLMISLTFKQNERPIVADHQDSSLIFRIKNEDYLKSISRLQIITNILIDTQTIYAHHFALIKEKYNEVADYDLSTMFDLPAPLQRKRAHKSTGLPEIIFSNNFIRAHQLTNMLDMFIPILTMMRDKLMEAEPQTIEMTSLEERWFFENRYRHFRSML